MAKKKYVDSHAALGCLYRNNPKLVNNMKVGDEYAVVMDNCVCIVSLIESDETASGTDYVIKTLRSVQGEGLVNLKRTKEMIP